MMCEMDDEQRNTKEQSVTGLALIVIRLVRQMAGWLLAWPLHHPHTSRLGPAGWENILTEILKYFTLDKYLNIVIKYLR